MSEQEAYKLEHRPLGRFGLIFRQEIEMLAKARKDGIIGSREQAVYMVLATYADKEGVCWPSVVTLAKDLGCTIKTVSRALTVLSNAGIISRQRRWNNSSIINLMERKDSSVPTPSEDSSVQEQSKRTDQSLMKGQICPPNIPVNKPIKNIDLKKASKEEKSSTARKPKKDSFEGLLRERNWDVDIEAYENPKDNEPLPF